MPRANGIEQANGKIRKIRADQADMQQGLRVHHMAVSPLAHGERLFNS
jgi:hypothetical protein